MYGPDVRTQIATYKYVHANSRPGPCTPCSRRSIVKPPGSGLDIQICVRKPRDAKVNFDFSLSQASSFRKITGQHIIVRQIDLLYINCLHFSEKCQRPIVSLQVRRMFPTLQSNRRIPPTLVQMSVEPLWQYNNTLPLLAATRTATAEHAAGHSPVYCSA
jgi:hypothetical protein